MVKIASFMMGAVIGILIAATHDILNQQSRKDKKVRKSTGKFDISGQEIFEGDIIESHIGGRILNQELVIKYGTYQAYCPCDECYMDSIGFYVSGKNLPDMPVGPLEDYAKVVGNIGG